MNIFWFNTILIIFTVLFAIGVFYCIKQDYKIRREYNNKICEQMEENARKTIRQSMNYWKEVLNDKSRVNRRKTN